MVKRSRVNLQLWFARVRTAVAIDQGLPGDRFQYKDLGNMATIGRNKAIADIGPLEIAGFIARPIGVLVLRARLQ